jgi:hypothetical protein
LVADLPVLYGPDHTYLGASPGCWQLYLEVSARVMSHVTIRGLLTDTYMVQHPGIPSRQSIQSVARHLLGLYWALERGQSFEQAVKAMRRAPAEHFIWLEPPRAWALTIVDLAGTSDQSILVDLIKQWAHATWDDWQPHHETIRQWAAHSFA